jgi:hypothetical protein
MALKKYLTISSLLLAISGCSSTPQKEIVYKTEYIGCEVEIQPRPDPVKLDNIYWYVVTKENFSEFEKRFAERHDEFVFYAISVPDYEDLSVNMSELKRYIEQQKNLIIYYEQNIKSGVQ